MKLVLAQINPVVGALAHNAALITDVWQAHKGDCDLVVFPELALSGYPPEDLVQKPAYLDALKIEAKKLCALQKKGDAAMLVSTPWMIDGLPHNALLLIEDGAIAHVIPKHQLPNYGVFDEMRVFKAGPLPKPVSFRGKMIGFMTCEDMWSKDVARHLAAHGAQALIVPNGSPYVLGKTYTRVGLSAARVAETGLPLIYLNLVGGQDDLIFDGASFGMNADGEVAFRMKKFESDVCAVTLSGSIWKTHKTEEWSQGIASVYGALKLGVHDYVRKNGFKSILIGLSGGIDSALVAVIAAEALGAENVHCVMMPSPYTAQMSLDDAQALAKNIGCDYRVMNIEDGMKAFDAMLGADAQKGVTPENIQSRLRGMMLMALSNTSGAMVISTGNKSEMAVGYATLYGDMCGGYAPLKDIYKTKVFELCKWLNARSDKPIMPERIITRPPSAELRPDQTDQDNLPSYDVLDALLEGFIEGDMAPADMVAKGFDGATATRVYRMLDLAEYKRRQSAPGAKVTPRAFGRDRRYPITNGFKPSVDPGVLE